MSSNHFGSIAPFDEKPNRISYPKLLVLDVDGVLTDGTKIYTPTGVLGKRFFERDFTAMKEFKRQGVQVVCMTSDPMNVALLAVKSRHIRVHVAYRDSKIDTLTTIAEEHGVGLDDWSEVAYVGDDLEDFTVLRSVKADGGWAFTPANHHPKLDQFNTLPVDGGEGVVEYLYWTFFKEDLRQ